MITEPSSSAPQQPVITKTMTSTATNSSFHDLPSFIENENENTLNRSDMGHEMLFANGTSILGNSGAGGGGSSSSSSNKSKRLLTFNIEFYKTKFQLYLPDNNTVLDLKKLIAEEIKLPVKNQKLKGFRNKVFI